MPDALEQHLGEQFRNPALLQEALTHSSHVNEGDEPADACNERLEYLGDAIIGFLVAEFLFLERPDLAEGDLTSLRAALVRGRTLGKFAAELRLGEALRLGRGEEGRGGRSRQGNLACAFEALVGAVYQDRGLDAVREFLLPFVRHEWALLSEQGVSDNYKSQLQEHVQRERQITPNYEIVSQNGPEHAPRFEAIVRIGPDEVGRGQGLSKQSAEQAAAADALQRLPQDEAAACS